MLDFFPYEFPASGVFMQHPKLDLAESKGPCKRATGLAAQPDLALVPSEKLLELLSAFVRIAHANMYL